MNVRCMTQAFVWQMSTVANPSTFNTDVTRWRRTQLITGRLRFTSATAISSWMDSPEDCASKTAPGAAIPPSVEVIEVNSAGPKSK